MHLIIVLRLLAGEDRVQRHLIGLVHHGTMAAHHLADVELREAGDVLEVLLATGDNRIRSFGFGGVRPKNDNVGKHNINICGELSPENGRVQAGIG